MSQHDYDLANAAGSAFRSDANSALAAIVSNNSGATAPATTFAYQWWADTTTGLLKQRNAANSAWITIGTLASANLGLAQLIANTFTGVQKWAKGADVASAGALTLGTDGNYFDITGTTAVTSIGTLGVGTWVRLHFDSNPTLTHHATDLILPGGANIVTAAGDEAEFIEYASGDWRCVSYTRASGAALVGAVSQIQPITASIASNAITIVPSALSLDFRHTTLTNGAVTKVSGTPANLVIAATDSFGLVTAAGSQRLAILALNNAGTIELAAASLAGGVLLDETGVLTTATAATLGTHIKAAAVRTGVAYRVIGYLDATFTTATGWGSLALVAGSGGNAAVAMGSLGYGQTWQGVTRTSGTTYYNTTGRPISFAAYNSASIAYTEAGLSVNGVQVAYTVFSVGTGGGRSMCTGIIPPGASYVFTVVSGSWAVSELR